MKNSLTVELAAMSDNGDILGSGLSIIGIERKAKEPVV